MSEREQIVREVREQMTQEWITRFKGEQQMKLNQYRQLNRYIRKGETLFTGSSLMEQFPVSEFCLDEGGPVVYNRGIGGYTTDDFLSAADAVLLDPRPKKLFINIGTNDIRVFPEGYNWFAHLSENYRRICEIIRDQLPETEVYLMAYYPVNEDRLRESSPTPPVRTNEAVGKANRMVAALAEEFGFHYIDVNDGLKDDRGRLQAEHTRDGIHFDAAAYRTVFDRLKQYL